MKNCDLRNKEFRNFFYETIINGAISNSFVESLAKDSARVFSILDKEKISDSDLLRFYYELNKLMKRYLAYRTIEETLFDWKVRELNNEELNKFINIVYEEIGVTINTNVTYDYLIGLFCFGKLNRFYEIVRRFLDEV